MRLAASSASLPLTSHIGRFNIGNAFASSSRLQLRSISSTPSARQADKYPPRSGSAQSSSSASSSSSSSSSLSSLSDLVRTSSQGSPRFGKGSQGGEGGFGAFDGFGGGSGSTGTQGVGQRGAAGNVFTPAATPQSNAAAGTGRRGRSEATPELGQHLAPYSISHESLTSRPFNRKPSRVGPNRRLAETMDQLHKLRLNPGKPSLHDDSYKNGNLLSPYVSEMGRILPRSKTNLTRTSQKSVGKAIRRAKAMGIIPVLARSSSWRF